MDPLNDYLKIINLSKDEYKMIRFNIYKQKYGDIQYFQFISMIRYTPLDIMDNHLYYDLKKIENWVQDLENGRSMVMAGRTSWVSNAWKWAFKSGARIAAERTGRGQPHPSGGLWRSTVGL